MIDIKDKVLCCGCSACAQSCPCQCIRMVVDKEGFFYPQVDEFSCINCGLCNKVCPFENPYDSVIPVSTIAYKHSNDVIREHSSSGGAFSTLAEYVINQGGVVFGARFTKDWQVEISYAETIDELDQFRGSKYVQANVGESYIQCKKNLIKNRIVLYTGTPCQIAGLKHYLRKEYDNLLTAEVICHGVPSPVVWKSYLEYLVQDVSLISKINLRYKDKKGGYRYLVSGKNITFYNDFASDSIYCKGFIENYYLRPSCYNCRSKSCKSQADFSMGDCWGIESVNPLFSDGLGVSSICVNSSRGLLLSKLLFKNSINIPFDLIIRYNLCYSISAREPLSRAYFWKQYSQIGIKAIEKTIDRDMKPVWRFVRKIRNAIF